MNTELSRKLTSMGIGWFILKYAFDHGIDIGVSLPSENYRREGTYIATKAFHNDMIKDLITTGISNRVVYKKLGLDAIYIRKILSSIETTIIKSKHSSPFKRTSKHSSSTKSKPKCSSSIAIVQNGIPSGLDSCYNDIIRYADNVNDDEKVPGLCEYLLSEYDHIHSFVYDILGFDKDLKLIPIILSKKKPVKSKTIDDKVIARMIKRKIGMTMNNNILESEIYDILKMRGTVFSFSISGNYYHSGSNYGYQFEDGSYPYIVIYYKNISCNSFDEYKAKITMCLAHEYFHFVHDYFATKSFNSTPNKWENKAVKESLADFFSVLYLLHSQIPGDHKLSTAIERYKVWEKWFGIWPYSEALWYYYQYNFMDFDPIYYNYKTNGSIDKFLDVFHRSKDDIIDAYYRLIG